MKKCLVFITLLSLTIPLFAVSNIHGKIVDANTKIPLQYVDVALFKQSSQKMLTGVATDSLGTFTIPSIEDGKYRLRIFDPFGFIQQIIATGKAQ